MGAPVANTNAAKHCRFALGLLPKRLKGIERSVAAFRRTLEDAVVAARGEISLMDAAHLTTAAKWERLSQLTHHWLRTEFEKMGHADRLSFAREAARASAERDKCLRALKLDGAADPYEALYARPVTDLYARPLVMIEAETTPAATDPPADDAIVGTT